MNNEGWGLTSMLLFLCVLFFGLALSTIIYNKNFDTDKLEEKESKMTDDDIKDENVIEVDYKSIDDYEKLEEQLSNSALKYVNDKDIDISNYKVIIGLEQLKKENYIDDIVDPENNSKCSGYVVYDGNKSMPFIKCIGTYQTDNYNKNFE